MDRDNHRSTVFVPKKMMTALYTDDLKPSLFQHRDQFQPGEAGKRGHAATVIR